MAGRGRGRGRSRGILDCDLTAPGGLAYKSDEEGRVSPSSNHSEADSTSPASPIDSKKNDREDASANITTPTSGNNEKATLSLGDMKSILEDSRTYSDQNDVKRVLLCAMNFVRTEDDVKTLTFLLYNKCLEDSNLSKRGSEICDSLTGIEVGNVKFRSCLLSLVQADYKGRADLIVNNPGRFNGFLAFLCEIFGLMRTATNEIFKPLVNPLYDCFNLVLGPEELEDEEDNESGGVESHILDEDACENLSLQLQSVGRLLEENGEEQMRHLMNRIRTCIINSKSSPRVRCTLLEVVETYARGWEAANNDTTKFYLDMSVGIISGLVL